MSHRVQHAKVRASISDLVFKHDPHALCNSHIVVLLCLLLQNSTTGAKLFGCTPCPHGAKMIVPASVWAGWLPVWGPSSPRLTSATWGLGSLLFHGDRQAPPESDLEQLRQLPLNEKWCLWCKAGCAGWCGCHAGFFLIVPVCVWVTPQNDTWATSPAVPPISPAAGAQGSADEVQPLSQLPVAPWCLMPQAGCCAASAG